MRKLTIWFLNRFDTNRNVQARKQARTLKFRIKEEEDFYYPVAKVFANADCWFPHADQKSHRQFAHKATINPLMTNGLAHHYHLGESTFFFGTSGVSVMQTEQPKMGRHRCGVPSGAILFAYVPLIGHQAI